MKKGKSKSNFFSSSEYWSIRGNLLSNEEIIELIKKYRSGDLEARNTLIVNNIGLVHYVANGLKIGKSNVHYDDYIQQGILGLYKAIEKYDSSRGDFAPCAISYIMNELYFLTDEYNYQTHVAHLLSILGRKVRRYIKDYEESNYKFPSKEEIINKFNISLDHYNRLINALIINNLITNEDALKLRLESDEADYKYNYMINSLTSDSLEESVVQEDYSNHLKDIFERTLTGRQRAFLKLYMEGHNSVEIANMFGITCQAVCANLNNSFKKLKPAIEQDNEKANREIERANYSQKSKEQDINLNENVYIIDFIPSLDSYYLKCKECSNIWYKNRESVINQSIACPRCLENKVRINHKKRKNY